MARRLHQRMNDHRDNSRKSTLNVVQRLTVQRYIIKWLQFQIEIRSCLDQAFVRCLLKVTRGEHHRLRNGSILYNVVSRVKQARHHSAQHNRQINEFICGLIFFSPSNHIHKIMNIHHSLLYRLNWLAVWLSG